VCSSGTTYALSGAPANRLLQLDHIERSEERKREKKKQNEQNKKKKMAHEKIKKVQEARARRMATKLWNEPVKVTKAFLAKKKSHAPIADISAEMGVSEAWMLFGREGRPRSPIKLSTEMRAEHAASRQFDAHMEAMQARKASVLREEVPKGANHDRST
jgi:hypothetical protein